MFLVLIIKIVYILMPVSLYDSEHINVNGHNQKSDTNKSKRDHLRIRKLKYSQTKNLIYALRHRNIFVSEN